MVKKVIKKVDEGGIPVKATPGKQKQGENVPFESSFFIVFEPSEGVTTDKVVLDSSPSVDGCKYLKKR